MAKVYQICTRCVMDTSDTDIVFDSDGVCNHCTSYFEIHGKSTLDEVTKKNKLQSVIARIKEDGKNNEYDSVLGVSGGVDSSYMAYLAKQYGLKPLVVHLDNGWDSELAVMNIENIIQKLDLDLYTYVIDWQEFKDLQVAYLKSSVLDLEALSDHAILACLYKIAAKHKVKYILSGNNFVTEAILPESYRYSYKTIDALNIKAIHKKFGKVKLKTFPFMGLLKFFYYTKIRKIANLSIMNYIDYNKAKAKQVIIDELGWRDYGGKHHESIITRFYQSYILPKKFGIDKRKAHLSTLICSGQITRQEALIELDKDICDSKLLKEDLDYVPKKLGLSAIEFEEIMKLPIKSHYDYPNEAKYLKLFIRAKGLFKK